MCGIAGVVALDGHAIPELQRRLDVMSDLIAHRGPDGEGTWVNESGSAGMAHRRLSIIDTSDAGRQPMQVDDLVVTHNGEIYNYLELRSELGANLFETRTDTETILRGCLIWGDSVVDHLRGMFAFGLWDERQRRLLLARDRFGIKPLYYFQSGEGRLYFASEAKALLPFLPSIETDAKGLRDYLIFQQPLEGRTLFRWINEVPAAHTLTVADGDVTLSRYWEVFYDRDFGHDDTYFIDKTDEVLQESMKLHLRSDVPVGAYVSGGIDSSLVASLAAQDVPILGFTGYADGAAFDERKYARTVSNSAGIELLEVEVRPEDAMQSLESVIYHMDYPVAGPGALPQYVVSGLAAEHRKVVLGGQGGDEIFGGYARYLIAYLEQCLKGAIDGSLNSGDFVVTYESIIPNLNVLEPYLPMLRDFFSDGIFEPMDRRYLRLMDRGRLLGDELKISVDDPYDPRETFLGVFNSENVDNGSYFDSMTHADFKTLLPALLQVEDRVGMAHGLEARVPLLDHRLVELAATMPADVKFLNGTLKRVLKQVARRHIPEEVVDRQDKMGFPIPIIEWMRGPLNGWVRDIFDTGNARQRDYVDSSRIPDLLTRESGFGRTFWGYLSLEIWQQSFHDRQSDFAALDPESGNKVGATIRTEQTEGKIE